MADEISDLRLFTRLVDAGSLTEAARRLNTSLPTISRRLAGLEARLGVRLVDRSSRKFLLTEEGYRFRDRATAIIAAINEAEAEAARAVDTAQGRLRVSAPPEIGRRRLAGLIASFAEVHPEIEIEYLVTEKRLGVRNEDLDVAIQTKRPTDGDVISRKLLSSRRVVCGSPDYLRSRGTPAAPSDLAAHNCIRMERGREVYSRWRFVKDGEEHFLDVAGTLVSNSGDVIHGWAREGRGLAMKALWDVEEDLAAGQLVEVLEAFAHDDINLYATYATRTHLPPRVRLFLDFLARGLSTTSAPILA
ncbi:LysR family transcriptional regulator [uncultured Sphingomonas sp.]|uniref:LysR family transcriptional regulator n=1 Tax=uncultured Sphingomonas sp. TaxID=158754 RepID=UPI0035CB2AE1